MWMCSDFRCLIMKHFWGRFACRVTCSDQSLSFTSTWAYTAKFYWNFGFFHSFWESRRKKIEL
jgi:hypothetical protein